MKDFISYSLKVVLTILLMFCCIGGLYHCFTGIDTNAIAYSGRCLITMVLGFLTVKMGGTL